jgi:hypothetical protein
MLESPRNHLELQPWLSSNVGGGKEAVQSYVFHGDLHPRAWLIWKQRNDAIFNHGRPSFQKWKLSFLAEARLQAHRLSHLKKLVFNSVFS